MANKNGANDDFRGVKARKKNAYRGVNLGENSALNSALNSANFSAENSALNSADFCAENSAQNIAKNSQNSVNFNENSRKNSQGVLENSPKNLVQKVKNHFIQNKIFYLCLVLTYAFSILCRLYWIWWASDFEAFKFNNELMINSNDGYVFAEGARDKIAGFHQPNDLSFIDSPLSILTYFAYKFTPFSLETIILYMSVFLSSLIILPILLIAKIYQNLSAGVIAALVASVANSYYNRTMAGYFDTDMLVIVLPMMIVYLMIRFIIKKDIFSLVFAPLTMSFYLWYYPSSFSLNCALIGLFFVYILLFHRKESVFYFGLILFILPLSNFAYYIEIALFLGLLVAYKYKKFSIKLSLILGILALIFVGFSGAFDAIFQQINFYVFKNDAVSSQNFVYYSVSKTIQEASNIDISMFMQRIISSEIAFVFAFFGLILLFKAHKSFILALPMLLLGFLALKGGLRFTIYAVPIMALGLGYFVTAFINYSKNTIFSKKSVNFLRFFSLLFFVIFMTLSFLSTENKIFLQVSILCFFVFVINEFHAQKMQKSVNFFVFASALFFTLGFAFVHIYNYKASTVFSKNEVLILDKLKGIAQREDYVVAWWDYGYPLRFYSDIKTLVDGGKHLGKDNFFPSFILSQNATAGANLARLAVEYTEKSFFDKNDTLLQNDMLKAMLRDYDFTQNTSGAALFFDALKSVNFALKTPKTRDIYLYMPLRMSMIYPTIANFSRIDLQNGELNSRPIFSTTILLGQLENGAYFLSNSMALSSDFTSILVGEREFKIHTFFEFNSLKNSDFNEKIVDENGLFYVFYIKENFLPIQFIIMDKSMFESAFVQMFFLENYDENLFDLIINEKEAKVFRLKR